MIPDMKTGNDLISALEILPKYNNNICQKPIAERLIALSDLYNIYIPSDMSIEIYNKLYLSLLQSLKKKSSSVSIIQRYENHKAIISQEYRGIMGGTDSFTIIGCSGIGKSTSISRAINLISNNSVIQLNNPYTKIIPCLVVQCPFDSSVKGLLLEILRKVDEQLGSNYYEYSIRRNATTDMLIGCASQIALNHIGILIVDEIQNVCNNKNGKKLIGILTQLINNSGISICMVGTPECSSFFEQEMQLARRSLGLKYDAMKYDIHFKHFCEKMLSYRYVKQEISITNSLIEWLYEHSGGIASVVVSLIHDAQEIAILTQKESLDIETLTQAYQKRLSLLHEHIKIKLPTKTIPAKSKQSFVFKSPDKIHKLSSSKFTLKELVDMSKKNNTDAINLIKETFIVEEVKI